DDAAERDPAKHLCSLGDADPGLPPPSSGVRQRQGLRLFPTRHRYSWWGRGTALARDRVRGNPRPPPGPGRVGAAADALAAAGRQHDAKAVAALARPLRNPGARHHALTFPGAAGARWPRRRASAIQRLTVPGGVSLSSASVFEGFRPATTAAR